MENNRARLCSDYGRDLVRGWDLGGVNKTLPAGVKCERVPTNSALRITNIPMQYF